jgi:hypothetical protein
MTGQDYEGIITSVEATSSHVKVQLDTVPGKMFVWLMTMFISQPRPEVGKQLTCTARPGPHDEFHVQRLISITDAPAVSTEIQQAVHAEVNQGVSTEISPDPTTLPLPSGATTLDQLAERILELKAKCKDSLVQNLLDFKWHVGGVISAYRGKQDPETFRDLEARTGVSDTDLVQCVRFHEKYPNHDYELKAWRELRAELPEKAEAIEKPALVVDTKHLWVCPECNAKFEHVHVSENKHRLQECKAD